MDDRLRSLERQAQAGDPDAAYRYFLEVCRSTEDLQAHYDAMMLLFEVQNPKLAQQLEDIRRICDMADQINRQIEDPPFSTEIWISDNTLEVEAGQRLDLHTSYGFRITQVSGATPDVFI